VCIFSNEMSSSSDYGRRAILRQPREDGVEIAAEEARGNATGPLGAALDVITGGQATSTVASKRSSLVMTRGERQHDCVHSF
jgi:hypothetical protein